MGLVLKQSFRNLISTYIGFGIGAINVLFLYPNFLTPEYYGVVSYVLSASMLCWPLMALGTQNTLVKFYSSYKEQPEKDRLFTLTLVMPLCVGLILGGIGYCSYTYILEHFTDQNVLVQPYVWLIFVIAIAMAYFELFFSWSKVFLKSSFGNVMREIFHRLCISILLLLLYNNVITITQFMYALAMVYILRVLVMMCFAFTLHLPKLSFKPLHNLSSVIKYSVLICIAGSVAMVLLDLDKVMIEYYLPIENVAIYGIFIYIASVIAVPSRAMHQITYPLTAELLNSNNTVGLKDLYKRSSNTLLVISGLIFLLIICNVKELYEMIPKDYHNGFSIVILIGIVKLYDNSIGNNNSILFNSNYYRLVLTLGVLCAVMAFVFNMFLIPKYGIFGACYATCFAFFIYNSIKVFVVWKKFGIQPFSQKTVTVLGLIFGCSLSFYFWDFTFHPIINILLKAICISTVFVLATWKFKLSKDVTIVIESFYNKILKA